MARERGIYATEYGNAAYVHGPKAKTAYDLDMAELIPIEQVTNKMVRMADDEDEGLWEEAMCDRGLEPDDSLMDEADSELE